jgi:hypothetical protein
LSWPVDKYSGRENIRCHRANKMRSTEIKVLLLQGSKGYLVGGETLVPLVDDQGLLGSRSSGEAPATSVIVRDHDGRAYAVPKEVLAQSEIPTSDLPRVLDELERAAMPEFSEVLPSPRMSSQSYVWF